MNFNVEKINKIIEIRNVIDPNVVVGDILSRIVAATSDQTSTRQNYDRGMKVRVFIKSDKLSQKLDLHMYTFEKFMNDSEALKGFMTKWRFTKFEAKNVLKCKPGESDVDWYVDVLFTKRRGNRFDIVLDKVEVNK